MKPLTLTLKSPPSQRVDLATLTPDRLQGLRPPAIAKLALQSGNRKVTVGDLFALNGHDVLNLHLRGDCRKFDNIGSGMRAGSITVHGDTGHRLGAAMRGGQITVHGDTGDWLGSGMNDGRIEVRGNAGDRVGAAFPGEAHGMNNGTILITGNAGARVGDGMRRGIIIIKGNAGDYCGARMLAGSILALGTAGEFAGLGMRRGSIILGRRPVSVTASFNSCGILKMQFLRILFRRLTRSHPNLSELKRHGPLCERYCGDLSTGGKGEIMILCATYPY